MTFTIQLNNWKKVIFRNDEFEKANKCQKKRTCWQGGRISIIRTPTSSYYDHKAACIWRGRNQARTPCKSASGLCFYGLGCSNTIRWTKMQTHTYACSGLPVWLPLQHPKRIDKHRKQYRNTCLFTFNCDNKKTCSISHAVNKKWNFLYHRIEIKS